jgi:hypothetical protein
MTDFCPDGYVPAIAAMFSAAGYWFPKQWAALWEATAQQTTTKPDNNFDAVVRGFSQSQIPAVWQDDRWRHEFETIWSQTGHRLRNLLHQDTIKAYYFDNNGCQAIARNFWPTFAADGVLETGIYWPFGKPTRSFESRPNHSLFLLQSELDALLNEQPAEKPGLPRGKIPDLVAALRTLDHLPNRETQRQALRKSPEFERYHLTDDVLREAEKHVPRRSGRRPFRPKR